MANGTGITKKARRTSSGNGYRAVKFVTRLQADLEKQRGDGALNITTALRDAGLIKPGEYVIDTAPPKRPITHNELRLAAIRALARAFDSDHAYADSVIRIPEPPGGEGRIPEVSFARMLAKHQDWFSLSAGGGWPINLIFATLVKLAMGARLDLPAEVVAA